MKDFSVWHVGSGDILAVDPEVMKVLGLSSGQKVDDATRWEIIRLNAEVGIQRQVERQKAAGEKGVSE